MITMNSWVRVVPRSTARLRLFCFPYSGAGALAFRTWQNNVPGEIDICPVQLPGRENRFRETAFTSMSALVKPLAESLTPYLDLPFALYGHSLGALVAFEVARTLRAWGTPQPVHLLVSGCHAPQIARQAPPIHQLPDAEFLVEVERFGGTSREVLANKELMQLVLPTLRADLEIYDTYTYVPEPVLAYPIAAYGGWQDARTTHESLSAWQAQTAANFTLHMFAGSHFFLQTEQERFLSTLTSTLFPHF